MSKSFLRSALCATTILSFGFAVPAFAGEATQADAAQPANEQAAPGDVQDQDGQVPPPVVPASTDQKRTVSQSPATIPGSDIIVTARREQERLQDVPISITVFNQEQLEQRNVVSATDLATYTPSLSANNNFGSENTTFAIRGFAQDIGTAPSVGVYFADVVSPRGASNGVPTGDGALPGSFFDLQNVQVLKGPQGTLFGRNTTGGAVLLVPKKPVDDFEGYVEGSIGNYDLRRVQAVLNVPISDTFLVRAGLDRMTRDGYIHNTSGHGPSYFGDVDYWAGRLSVVANLTPNLENYIIASYTHSDTNGPATKLVAADAREGLGRYAAEQLTRQGKGFYDILQPLDNSYSKVDQWQIIDTTTWQATDLLTLKNIISYAQYTQTLHAPEFATDFRVTPSRDLAQLAPLNPLTPLPAGTYEFPFTEIVPPPGLHTADQYTFTEEFQIQGRTPNDRLDYQGGVYLESSRPLGTAGSQSPFLADCKNYGQDFQCTDPIGFEGFYANQTAGLIRNAYLPAIAGGIAQINGALGTPGLPPAQAAALQAQLQALQQQQAQLQGALAQLQPGGQPIPAHVGSVNFTTGRTDFHDIGIYAQATYKLTDKLSLTGGIRYTWDRQDNVSTRKTYIPQYPPNYGLFPAAALGGNNPVCTDPTAFPTCVTRLHQQSDAPTWLVDVDYKPSDNLLVYAKYARGYRAATIAPNVSAPLNLVGAEKVDSYEAGLKSTFTGFLRGTFNVAGFYNDFSNQQLQVGFNAIPGSGQASTASPVNAGKSEIYGAEVEGTLSPFRGFDISGSYTYLHTEIKSVPDFSTFNDPNFTLSAPFRVGDPEVLSPKNKFSITGSYTLPLDDSIGKITFGATFTHRDKMLVNYTDRQNIAAPSIARFSYVGALDLLNLNFSWNSIAGSPVDLSVFATNVTKEKYYTFAAGLGDPSVGFETASLGEPRMYGARLRVRFGR